VELYAAYATNMDPRLMAERCPHSPLRGNGWLEGWRLTFGGEDISWEGALATVVEEPDERVLDHWDGVNLGYFHKIRIRVETLDGSVVAWLYVLNHWEGGLPSARYLGIVADAAEAAGAPADYVASLRSRPCASLG
jgi:hypothetical protein